MNKVMLLSRSKLLFGSAFEFADMLTRQKPIYLYGVFLPKQGYWNSQDFYKNAVGNPWLLTHRAPKPETSTKQDLVTRCDTKGIRHQINLLKAEALRKDLIVKTRFSNLLLVSNASLYESLEEEIEAKQDIINSAECPVIVIPNIFYKSKQVILAHDGPVSSVHAIKQFATVLPAMIPLPTTAYVDQDAQKDFPDRESLADLCTPQFKNLIFLKVDRSVDSYFDNWLAGQTKSLLVTGASGRSRMSELFSKSVIGRGLKSYKFPLLIAHI